MDLNQVNIDELSDEEVQALLSQHDTPDLASADVDSLTDEQVQALLSQNEKPESKLVSPLSVRPRKSILKQSVNAVAKGLAGIGDLATNAAGVLAAPYTFGHSPNISEDGSLKYLTPYHDIGESSGVINRELDPETTGGKIAEAALQGAMFGPARLATAGAGALTGALSKSAGELTGSPAVELATGLAVPGVSMAAGAGRAEKIAANAANQAARKKWMAENPDYLRTLGESAEAGYKFSPGLIQGYEPRLQDYLLQKMVGKTKMENAISTANFEKTQELAKKHAGIEEGFPLDDAGIAARKEDIAAESWEPIVNLKPQISVPAGKISGDVADIVYDARTPIIKKDPYTLKEIVTYENPNEDFVVDTGQLIKRLAELRHERNSLKRNSFGRRPEDTQRMNELTNSIGQLERTFFDELKMRPDGKKLISKYKQGNKDYAKISMYEDARIEGTNAIDPRYLARRLQKGGALDAEGEKIARFANVFKQANKLPANIGTKDSEALGAVIAGATGSNALSVGKSLITSKVRDTLQNRLLTDAYQKGLIDSAMEQYKGGRTPFFYRDDVPVFSGVAPVLGEQ